MSFADTFNWTYTGSGVDASGTFTASPNADGTFQITGISGERNGELITGLSTFGFADNMFYPEFPYFDYAGLSFIAGGIEFNLYGAMQHTLTGDHGILTEAYFPTGPDGEVLQTELTDFTLTRVGEAPEPASMWLVSAGLIGALTRVRKRSK
jgi:hypothetical protein